MKVMYRVKRYGKWKNVTIPEVNDPMLYLKEKYGAVEWKYPKRKL